MSRMVQYTIASVCVGSVADSLGASMPLAFFAALIGPPLLHFLWLLYNQPR
ncbi:MAG: hypothetical protein ACI9OJ_000406 [Myxococcota bacterium]|jgi:hypothetical protein